MIGAAVPVQERRRWSGALAVALAAHALAAVGVFALVRPIAPREPDPVMLVELPPLPPPAASPAVAEPQPVETPDIPKPVEQPMPKIEAPKINMPVPQDAVTVPPKVVQPQPAPAPAPAAAPAPAPPVPATATPSIGDDPKARKAELNYYQMLMAYLARKKAYPPEAKQARQQGVVTIRFTVDRQGRVSGEGIKRSSGYDTLDQATLDLLRRVAPLPAMPPSMDKDSVTVALPIEYSLKTN
jgi:protein TonB